MADIGIHSANFIFLGFNEMKKNAFTLIEVILVVTILGILGALILPTFQGHLAGARESAAKDSLRTMRTQIELYKWHHGGSLPGYANGNPVGEALLALQFTATTTVDGAVSPSTVPDGDYVNGPYVLKLPENPFNDLSNIAYVAAATDFSAAVDGTSSGWLYKKETGEFRINWTGNDSEGVAFIDY